ncbi:hypothetical protein HOLleu_02741 [Holothuria leucospilota]|uniref:Uncharacterized protein n=1 Tax=Holothuria leucospilota TaxID=206669 RepID=A0A9Q1CRR5_HOLLE|nr:hypothetical protein HOLleu_02741 [Holothuria leucospilota]
MISPPTASTIRREVHVQPEDHLALSVFVLACCFSPAGIVALVKSIEVCTVGVRFRAGDYSGALESSRFAKAWARGGFICGTVTWLLVAIFTSGYIVFIYSVINEAVHEETAGNSHGFHYSSHNLKQFNM